MPDPKAEEEAPKIKQQAAHAPGVKDQAKRAADQAKQATNGHLTGSHATR